MIHVEIEKRYMDWIRGQDCVVFGCTTYGHPHHLRGRNLGGGTGLKPNDLTCIPLCHKHHTELHHIGIDSFEKLYGLDLVLILMAKLQGYIYYQGRVIHESERRRKDMEREETDRQEKRGDFRFPYNT